MAREESYKWLEEANNDFEMGNILLNSEKFNGADFHYQQMAVKSLKAALYYNDNQPWGHSILSFINDLINLGEDEFKDFKSDAREIDRHYTTSRYPDALPNISPKEAYDKEIAVRIQEKADKILKYVNDYIKEDNH